jgi:hypothetical protein
VSRAKSTKRPTIYRFRGFAKLTHVIAPMTGKIRRQDSIANIQPACPASQKYLTNYYHNDGSSVLFRDGPNITPPA